MPRIEAVDVRGVTRAFGGRPVLRGVTTRFERGTVTFIEGPNGAGKSTLLGVVGTTLSPTTGSVHFEPMGNRIDAVRRELGWLAHDGRMYRELTARENVELAARLHGEDVQSCFEAVSARLGLRDFADQAVATLSRGQRQRVALARALVHRPSLLLLDEPLTGLDVESADRLANVIAEERSSGTILVVVSHTVGFPERVGGRRLRLERGKVVRDEPV